LQIYLKNYAQLAENNCPDELLDGLRYLVKISEVEDTEIFKVCLEFWNTLAGELYRESPNNHYIHTNLAYNTPQVNKYFFLIFQNCQNRGKFCQACRFFIDSKEQNGPNFGQKVKFLYIR